MTRADQVDTVAQAIRAAFLRRQGGTMPRPWAAIPEQLRESFRLEAVAAIEAYEGTHER